MVIWRCSLLALHKCLHADVELSTVAHVTACMLELMQVYAPKATQAQVLQHAIL